MLTTAQLKEYDMFFVQSLAQIINNLGKEFNNQNLLDKAVYSRKTIADNKEFAISSVDSFAIYDTIEMIMAAACDFHFVPLANCLIK